MYSQHAARPDALQKQKKCSTSGMHLLHWMWPYCPHNPEKTKGKSASRTCAKTYTHKTSHTRRPTQHIYGYITSSDIPNCIVREMRVGSRLRPAQSQRKTFAQHRGYRFYDITQPQKQHKHTHTRAKR